MGWGDAREQRRWQREFEAQLRSLPTSDLDTPDGGPVSPVSRRPIRSPARSRERRRTVLTLLATGSMVAVVSAFTLTGYADRLQSLIGWDGDRGESSSYAFLQRESGSGAPVTWSACEPIRYVVNPQGAPDGWESTLQQAVEVVSDATGLEMIDDGTTDDRDFDRRHDGRGRALPVLVGWASPQEQPELEGDTVGLGGPQTSYSTALIGRTAPLYTSGAVILDAGAFETMERAGSERQQVAIVMHELGHLLGLDHVDDDKQLMYPTTTFQTTFGNGDLEGLRQLGDGPCQ